MDEQINALASYVDKYAEEKHRVEFKTNYDEEPSFPKNDYQIYTRMEYVILGFGPNASLQDDARYQQSIDNIE